MVRKFPPDFVWGAGTSAFQIEGSTRVDGRGDSIWDEFCRVPGRVLHGDTGDVACDHYQRFREDIELMRAIGLRAYRFSISWPRVLASGRGAVNAKGLDFYDRLIDALLAAGIEPFPTLFHWDLPQALQEQGGWLERATAEAFAEYTEQVARKFGDRIRHWATLNEPWCISFLSHQIGLHAPGMKDWSAAIRASHHVMLAHGWAVRQLRSHASISAPPRVGIVLNLTPADPQSSGDADAAACRLFDGYFNRWFLDPLYIGGYPADMLEHYVARGFLSPRSWDDLVKPGDLEVISEPTDFLGVNYYRRAVIRGCTPEERAAGDHFSNAHVPEAEYSDMGWEIHPQGLADILRRLRDDYGVGEVFITENGASYSDSPDARGIVADSRRIRFLHGHLEAAHQAIADGVNLRGYFVWSLLDNFEWERGYTQRFGLIWTDYDTQRRIPKRSADWYAKVISSNAIESR